MNVKVSVKGLDKLLKKASPQAAKEIMNRADNTVSQYTRKSANDSAGLAPVKTGALRSSIPASVRKLGPAKHGYGAGVPYDLVQEYTNPTKSGFYRKSVAKNKVLLRDALRNDLKR